MIVIVWLYSSVVAAALAAALLLLLLVVVAAAACCCCCCCCSSQNEKSARNISQFFKILFAAAPLSPQAVNSFLFTLVEVVAVLVVISVSFPVFAVVILPLAVLYYALLRIYIPASR